MGLLFAAAFIFILSGFVSFEWILNKRPNYMVWVVLCAISGALILMVGLDR